MCPRVKQVLPTDGLTLFQQHFPLPCIKILLLSLSIKILSLSPSLRILALPSSLKILLPLLPPPLPPPCPKQLTIPIIKQIKMPRPKEQLISHATNLLIIPNPENHPLISNMHNNPNAQNLRHTLILNTLRLATPSTNILNTCLFCYKVTKIIHICSYMPIVKRTKIHDHYCVEYEAGVEGFC